MRQIVHRAPAPAVRIRWWGSLLLLLCVVNLCGCRLRDDATRVATDGNAAATALASYYDTLVQDTLDTWELEAIFRGTATPPIPFPAPEQRVYQARLTALRARGQAARDLAAVYGAFEHLTTYRSADTIRATYARVTQHRHQLPPLSGSAAPPASLLLAQGVTDLRQVSDIKAANALILHDVTALATVFQQEQEAYQLIGAERHTSVSAVGRRLLEQKKLNGKALLERIPMLVDLPWATGQPTLEEPGTINLMVALLLTRSERRAIQAEQAAVNLALALHGMVQNHTRLLTQQAVRLQDVLPYARDAQRLLDAVPSSSAPAPVTEGDTHDTHP